MSLIELEQKINYLLDNLDKIPDEFWIPLEHHTGERVIWLLNRQKPSVEQSYDFDEERFGITKSRRIVWGFDSGCSCPSPWTDASPNVYSFKKTWKGFFIKSKEGNEYQQFDKDWDEEAYNNLKDYLLLIRQANEEIDVLIILTATNAEIRRYLIKRVGYENIKNHTKVEVLHIDGTSELLKINDEKYVKVKDSSTDREYLIYVPNNIKTCREGIAWTFDLKEEEYDPIEET